MQHITKYVDREVSLTGLQAVPYCDDCGIRKVAGMSTCWPGPAPLSHPVASA